MTDVLTEHYTDVANTRIHWVEAGSGDDSPLILIHGWGSSTVKWQDAIPMLATQRRVIALDLPGFGRSSIPDGSYSPAWLAGAVRAFMDEIAVPRGVVVGNSLGGLVSIYIAATWPERVHALVPVAPLLPNDGPVHDRKMLLSMLTTMIPGVGELAFARYARRPAEALVAEGMQRNFFDPARANPLTVRALEEEARRRAGDRDAQRAVVRASRRMMWSVTAERERIWGIVRSLAVPTLFVWGDKDRVLPPHIGQRALGEVKGAHLITLQDCGHNPQVELPEDFSAAVLSFTRALR